MYALINLCIRYSVHSEALQSRLHRLINSSVQTPALYSEGVKPMAGAVKASNYFPGGMKGGRGILHAITHAFIYHSAPLILSNTFLC